MPIYRFNNETYDIPDDVVKDFERDNPTATISYSAGNDIYEIPVSEKEGFLKQFPDAKLYTQQPNAGVPAGNETSGQVLMQGESQPDQAVPDSEIQRLKNIQSTAQQQIDNASFFDRYFDADTRAAVATRNKAEEALEVYDEANREKENWFDRNVVGAFKGFADKVGDLSTWDFGTSGLASAYALNEAYNKWEKGEKLTTAEQNMLDAYGLATAVQSAYQDQVGTAYNVGGSLPESLAFGASLAINPAGGAGKKLAESAAKAAVKKYGTSFVSKLAKGAARAGGDVLEMGVATVLPGGFRVAEDYYNRLNGQTTFDIDSNGIIRYGGQQDQEEADDAIWKAFGSQFIENYSEAMGNYFAPMGNVISGLTSKGLKAAHLGKLADVVNDISSSQFSKGLQRLKSATKFDGLVGEYLEEVAGNALNAATVGDMNFNSPDDPRSVFNPETNIETFLSCALLSGTMYAVEAPISMYNRNVAKKNLSNADIAATKVWDKDRWEDLRSQMDEADPQLLAQLLTGVQNATDLNDEQKQAAKEYGMRLMQFQGYNARRMQNVAESTSDANEINNAYDEGAEMQSPYDKHSAKVAADKAEDALGDDAEFAQTVINGIGTPVATINAMAESGKYTEEQIERAKNYYSAVNRMNGMTDALLDDVDAKVESANVEVDMNTNKDLNQVIQVELRDGSIGYVVQGVVTRGEEGSVDVNQSDNTIIVRMQDGEAKQMNPNKDLAKVSWIESPDALKDANNNLLRQKLIDEGIAEIDWNPNTPKPKVGDAYVVDGIPTTIVGMDGKGSLFVVPTEKWQEAQNNEAQMQQLVSQASQNPILVSSFMQWASDQVDAQEEAVAVEQAQAEEAAVVQETSSSEIADNLEEVQSAEQPVAATEEGVSVKEEPVQQVVPTKEDGSIDFVAYGINNSLKELGNAYGEKMPHKVEVTAKAFADDLAKAQKAIEKAQEALDNAPIGRDAKQKEALEKAMVAYDEVKREADFWAEMDADIKQAQAERESLLNPAVEVDMSEEPMTTEEFIAKHLADGSIRLTSDSYKKELGYGEKERKRYPKMFLKAENGGMSIERAGKMLMQWDREEGTNFFDQEDANAGRDALINFLGSVQTWGDITGYIKNNREQIARRDSEGLRNEIETAIEQNYHMTPADYATSKEVEAVENPFEGVALEELDAIFALTLEEYYEYERNQSNEQGAEAPAVEGSNDVLLEEQADNARGTEQGERTGEPDSDSLRPGTESGSTQAEETRNRRFVNTFEVAERIDREERRLRPIRQRIREWMSAGIKINVIERVEDIPNRSVANAIAGKNIVPGWYEVANGEVYVFLPHVRNVKDLDATVIHEALSHKGIRNLIGEESFGELCDKVWNSMSEEAKAKYSNYEGVKDIKNEKAKHRAAADEYMAHLAEQQTLTPQEKSIWDNIVMFFRDMLDKALNGILSKSEITDEDIAKLIRISYANLKTGVNRGVVGEGTRFKVENDTFNRDLERYKNGEMKSNEMFNLGTPKGIMEMFLPNLPIVMRQRVVKKGTEKKHNVDLSALVDMPSFLFEPIFVFKREDGALGVLTEMQDREGKNVCVAIELSKNIQDGGDYIEVNDIRSFHGREIENIVSPIAEKGEKVLKWVDKEKGLAWLSSASQQVQQETVKKDLLSATNLIETFENPKESEWNPALFRVIDDKSGRKSLVGLHNISEEKLRKAIKQGGLANPSMAVIDMDKQSHVDYGDITLVAPSSLIDKKTGKNIGTYTADAYTPIYPTVTKQLPKNGQKKLIQALQTVNESFRSKVKSYFESYLNNGSMYDALYYWYLADTGKNPPTLEAMLPEGYTREELEKVKSVNPKADAYFELSDDEKQRIKELYAERFYGSLEDYDKYLEDYIKRMKDVVNDETKLAMVRKSIENNLRVIEEYGYEYDYVAGYYSRAITLANRQSKPSDFETFRNAHDEVVKNNQLEEFNTWLSEKETELGVEEKLFVGYDNQGRAKYVANTLENASKLMKKEGRAGATGFGGFNKFISVVAPNAKTLEQIKKKQGNLSDQEAYEQFTKKWSDVYHELASRLQPSADKYADYGYYRLEEMPTVKNPKEYVKKEYGLDLSDEFMQKYNDFVSAIKNDFPARYFETKFERPVYLNEFAGAVVPQGTSQDIVDALTEAGLPVEEYEKDNNEARMAAVDKVATEDGGVRFRFIGKRGAANLDQSEEATTRLDNLNVAREMEAAGKDAKIIKMATGWERGADGLWRYEVADNLNFDYYANVDYKKRHPELARFDDLRNKLNASLLMGTEPLTEEEQKEFDFLEKEFGGYKEYHNSRKLKDYLDASELFDAYPELRNVELLFVEMDKETLGKYLPDGNTILLNNNMKLSGRLFIEQVLVHEIQHAIQHIEGFEPGANKNMQDPNKVIKKADNREFMQKQLDQHIAERDELLKKKDELNDKMAAWYDSHDENSVFDDEMNEYNRQYDKVEEELENADRKVSWDQKWLETIKEARTELGEEGYSKVSGEVEARNVSKRMKMSDFDRRNTLAIETEDVAREDQIFLNESLGGSTMLRVTRQEAHDKVDEFTSKYSSKPVVVIESSMTDKEKLDLFDNAITIEEINGLFNDGFKAGYRRANGKIYIFADNETLEEIEEGLFHENLHADIENYQSLMDKVWDKLANDSIPLYGRVKEHYGEDKWKEEFFVYAISYGEKHGNLDAVLDVLTKEEQEELLDLLNKSGYNYERESKERNPGGTKKEIEALVAKRGGQSGRLRSPGKSVQQDNGSSGQTPRGKSEQLKELFDQVAEKGLKGVVGEAEYDLALYALYNAMPEQESVKISEASRKNGIGVASAIEEYIINNSSSTFLDKVVGSFRELLRKAGFDVAVSEKDIKYMIWRSKKPLRRNDALDVAEDIDARRHFGVGNEGGVRFRSSQGTTPFDPSDRRAKIVKEYDAFLKTGKFNFIEAFQDRMYSVKVLMDMIVKATGKKLRDFEDAYTAENQLGSVNKPAEEKYLKNFYKPLVEAVKTLSDKYGREAIERYIYCKSGLERNEVLRQRDADEAYNEAKAELDDKLAKNQITQAQYNVLLQQADTQRQQTLSEDVDYSGIRGMLYNVKAQAINKDYEEGRIDKATRDARLANLEANRKTEVQDWKQFAENQVAAIENQASSSELDDLWKKVKAATNETLRMDYESGMIDKATYDAEKKMMKYYVPLRNWADTTAEEMYEYRSELVRPVSSNQKRAKGRETQADNPIATIALMAQNAIVRGNRNKVKQKFYAFVANRETGLASVRDVWYVKDPTTGDWEAKYADTTNASDAAEFAQLLDDFETDMQLLEAQGMAYKGKLPQGMKFRASKQQKMSHVVSVMMNGKEYAVYVNGNPRPAQAINGETNSEAANASAWYDKLKRIYGAGLTSWNPDFIIPNMIRDGIHASTMIMVDAGPFAAAKFALNGPRAFAQVFAMVSGKGKNLVNPKNQVYFEEFVANGGETGYTAIHTLEDYKKEYDKLMKEVKGLKGKNLFKNGFEAASKWLEAANRIFEDVNRFNAYVSARESGESIMRSVDAAKNITVNFNRKGALSANSSVFGTIANAMSKWILFFNPAVQGIAQLVTKTKMNPKRAMAMSSTILASGFMMPMLNELLVAANGGDDEDDYWNQSDFKRRNNWMLFTGNGYASIPLPPVLRELYGIGDIIYGSITGHITPDRAVMDMARQVQSAIGFVNLIPEASQEPDMVTWAKGFAPDLASPVLDVISNTNFMGRPIAKWTSFNEYDPEYERVYKGVSPQWTELSKLLNKIGGEEGRRSDFWGNFINPAMMEHLFNSYGGGIGKTINNLAGMTTDLVMGNTENVDPFRKTPILPRFYTPNDEKTVVPGINRKYYDYEYMYNTAKKALKNYQEGIRSKEHPEYQKYIEEMQKNGEIQFIKFFEQESKRLTKIRNLMKGDPSNKEKLEERMIEIKADIATKCYEMLK